MCSSSGQSDAFVVGQPSPTEPIDRVCLYRNASIQKLLPTQLQQLFEENTRQSVEEALCVLYVALTRAIYSLHMIVKPSTASEKNLPKTAAGLVRAALTDGQRLAGNEVAFRTGDPRWYDKLTPRQATPALGAPAKTDLPVALSPMPVDSRLELTSPSQLEGGARVRVARILDLASSVATTRGTLMHALFEQIVWLDDGVPDSLRLRRIAESLTTLGLDVDEQLSAFQRMLRRA